jgi:hypothetical protein
MKTVRLLATETKSVPDNVDFYPHLVSLSLVATILFQDCSAPRILITIDALYG